MTKVLIAPDSLKDAANAVEIADAIEKGFLKAKPGSEIRKMPLADGGEYTLEILLEAMGGKLITTQTVDPLGNPIESVYGINSEGKAIIELPRASGVELLKKSERNPLYTSTYGTGLQIRDALDRGIREILLTLGGSATVDGGSGILQALGIRLQDRHGKEIPRGGGNLIILDKFDASGLISGAADVIFTLLCDVENPLLGAQGAAMTFAPQKGAAHIETMLLERCLNNFGEKCEAYSGKKLIGMTGGGAAGGVAVGLKTFFNTRIISGVAYILDLLEADRHISWADLVITAEGELDSQTLSGKAPFMLAKKAKDAGKKVICIAGRVPHRADHPDQLFDAVFAIQNRPMTLEESIASTMDNIMNTAFEIGRLIGD